MIGPRTAALGGLLCLLVGFWMGGRLSRPSRSLVPLPEQRLGPGSLVLARVANPLEGPAPKIPTGAKVKARAWADIEPLSPLEKIRVNVIELETKQGPRLQIQTDQGKILAGEDYRPSQAMEPRWGLIVGGIINRDGIHAAPGVSYTRGRWTVGGLAGIKSGQGWPGMVIYANFRF